MPGIDEVLQVAARKLRRQNHQGLVQPPPVESGLDRGGAGLERRRPLVVGVVARENFGPVVAQVAAVALMLDYIVTVAVQAAAGTNALTSALPNLGDYSLEITVAVVAVLAYGIASYM